MASKRKEREQKFVTSSGYALANAQEHEEIQQLMSDYFFGPEKLAEGAALVDSAQTALDKRHGEQQDANSAYDTYEILIDKLEDIYAVDKKKCRFCFKRDADAQARLRIDSSYPTLIDEQFNTIRTLYTGLTESETYIEKVSRVRITQDDLNARIQDIADVDAARKLWMQEDAEAQRATVEKNEILAQLDIWMDDFYDVVDLALIDQPQLKEALGIVVK